MRESGVNVLYVSPLPTRLSPRDVWDAFLPFGDILSLEAPLQDSDPAQIKGFAYVQYGCARSMEEAAAAPNDLDIMGARVMVEVHKEPPAAEPRSTAVCVRSIPQSWTMGRLLHKLMRFGVVTSARFLQPPGTAPELRIGIVNFATQQGADAAIEGMQWVEVVPTAPQASVGGSGAAAAAASAGGGAVEQPPKPATELLVFGASYPPPPSLSLAVSTPPY